MTVVDLVAAGNAALRDGRWADARAAFAAALGECESAEALRGMGEALWWLGETRSSVEYHERAYAFSRRVGDAPSAAWAGIWLCLTYKVDLGNHAAASGWLARVERVLRDAEPSPLEGWLWLTRAYEAIDVARSREFAERALELSRDSGDVDLEMCALAEVGKALVAAGAVEEGLRLVDEAMAGILAGESTRLDTVVFTSCSMLAACELASDLEHATQWCRVADAFIRKYGCPFLYTECRALYGGVLVATGHWTDAERELMVAIQMGKDSYPGVLVLALARLADLRLRQGRLEEAEELLRGADGERAVALPAARLRLARGESEVAIALLERCLSLHGERQAEAAQILELLVEAHLARGDLAAALAAARRLGALASGRVGDHVLARASLALARVSIAGGDPDAIGHLERASEAFSRVGLPLETARTQLELARVLAKERPAVAVVEAQVALATFERLGAAADADAAAALLRTLGVVARTRPKQVDVLTQREQEVLRLVGLGLSNPEIARRLVISRKTAAHHVSSVLAKLGLRNRAEAAAYATRTQGDSASR